MLKTHLPTLHVDSVGFRHEAFVTKPMTDGRTLFAGIWHNKKDECQRLPLDKDTHSYTWKNWLKVKWIINI